MIADANGLRFWMLAQARDWLPPAVEHTGAAETSDAAQLRDLLNAALGPRGLYFSGRTNRLRLLSRLNATLPAEDATLAAQLVELAPMTSDTLGTYARWDAKSSHVVAGGAGPGDVPIYAAPVGAAVTDLVMGTDGILYVAVAGALVLIDRRGRWPNATLAVADFSFWRLAVRADGGVLALDRNRRELAVVTGQPLQTGPLDTPDPGILRSCDQNANPPHIAARFALPPAAATETFVALCAMEAGAYALLSWDAAGTASHVRPFTEAAGFEQPLQLERAERPYTMTWIGEGQIAVLVTRTNEALIFDIASGGGAPVPAGDSYILTGQNLGPFVHGLDLPPRYPNPVWFGGLVPAWQAATLYTAQRTILDPNGNLQTVQTPGTSGGSEPAWNATPGQTTADDGIVWNNAGPLAPLLPLLPLSLNSFAPTGSTDPADPPVLDSGTSQTVWHRVFVEAIVPPKCGALIWLAASDVASDLHSAATRWYPHVLGDADTSGISPSALADVPIAAWQSESSEVPFGPALLDTAPARDRSGLFMVLVQRAGKAVRSLTGRYLGVRLELTGDSRNTPEIAALRAYASRFSYVEHYLPDIYREDTFGAAADQNGPSTRRDFLERFVDLFEAQLTRIEDRVANAYVLTRPEATPDAALDWLGAWVGVDPGGYPPDRRRARLEALPDLYRQRGTAPGIAQALDVATDGLCTSGAIIVIEAFRLRHLFATILGADLSIKDDPLLPGYSPSSNSIVGDALFLGDPRIQAELQALYETNLNLPGGQQAATAFFDEFANQLTVFVHDQVENVDFALVRSVVEEEKPAHVAASVVRATQALMIGLASLVGVNTYLGPDPPRGTATLNVSLVGRYDVITHMPALDPRAGSGQSGAEWANPVAHLSAPSHVAPGTPIILDGGASSAPAGATLVSFQWSLLST